MMNWVWTAMILLSFVCAAITGRGDSMAGALFDGAENAVTLLISLTGALCFWSGLMRIADKAGVTRALAGLFRPVLRLLFPGLSPESEAAQAISMNFSANLLGMGNAATPFGLRAMRELKKESTLPPGEADDRMVTFVVVNTASFQLIPSTIAMLRAKSGSTQPFAIMPQIWLTSLITLSVGLLTLWLIRQFGAAPSLSAGFLRKAGGSGCSLSQHG